MNLGLISIRYAKALLLLAQEKGESELIFEKMQALANAFRALPQLRVAIENPVLPSEKKKSLVFAAVSGAESEIFERFVNLIFQNKRENQLFRIALSYSDLYLEKNNIHYGRLTTATEISAEQIEKIKRLFGQENGSRLELETRKNPDLIGGFVLDIDGKRLDASVKTSLRKIRQELISRN